MTTQPPATTAQAPREVPKRAIGAGLGELRLSFDEDAHQGSTLWVRVRNALIAHVLFIALVLLGVQLVPERVVRSVLPEQLSDQIVWLNDPGPGGGGGGGGNRAPEPPKAAELRGADRITAPVEKPPAPKPEPPKPEEIKAEDLPTIPVQQMASADTIAPGVIAPPAPGPATSQGSGTGGGAGTGSGTGIGSGTGSGLGPGTGGGTGGGAYQPGNGVTTPVPIREVKPQYTAEAMRAKVQGTVWLQCVVMPDGSVGNVQVTKSLDQTFGLDQEAIKAARQWRFRPGLRNGEPVPVLITIELTFTLR